MNRFIFALFLVAALAASRADAQQLSLAIKDGRVTLDAHNVPVRQILTEWARIGGVKIINGEKVTGPAVTLQLHEAPERQALDSILRGVSGYMLAARPVGTAGASAFDRILILPTSAAPRNPPPQQASQPGQQMFQPGQPRPVPPMPIQLATEEPEEIEEQPESERVGVTPGVVMPGGRPPFMQGGRPAIPGMPVPPMSNDGQQPPQPVKTSPGNPFGLPAGSGGRPGSITPVQPSNPDQPEGAQPR